MLLMNAARIGFGGASVMAKAWLRTPRQALLIERSQQKQTLGACAYRLKSGPVHIELEMKFALVNGERSEAQPDLKGSCPACDRPVVARCGSLRVWHWAHKGKLMCDPWWEGETEWHRAWKGQFPADWQEVVHFAADGEKHIADVKTGDGWVLEFQHSALSADERRARTAFYPRLNWIVDGTRRKRDVMQFDRALREGAQLGRQGLVMKLFPDGCRLLEEWAEDRAPVFLDFGEPQRLWWLFARGQSGWAYVAQYPRIEFIAAHRGDAPEVARQFSSFVNEIPRLIAEHERQMSAPRSVSLSLPPNRFRRRLWF